MARYKRGIFGPIDGKLGPLIGSTWKGIPYLKEAPKKKRKKKRRSHKQLANEAKFKYINDWLVPMHLFLFVGFENLAIGKTALAAALSQNYRNVFQGDHPEIEIRYEELMISVGSLPGLVSPVINWLSPKEIELSWAQSPLANATYSDQLMLMLYCPAKKIADGIIGGATRAMGVYHHQLDPRIIGEALEVYISVISVCRKKVANSIYFGRIAP